eukprot:m.409013 g.409013  ORF g.409013 m.409013 type:complete len:387 (-) comp20152_c0_seq3:232-1392(-)
MGGMVGVEELPPPVVVGGGAGTCRGGDVRARPSLRVEDAGEAMTGKLRGVKTFATSTKGYPALLPEVSHDTKHAQQQQLLLLLQQPQPPHTTTTTTMASSEVDVRLASSKKRRVQASAGSVATEPGVARLVGAHHVVTPGEVITEEQGFMRGHGTFVQDGKLLAAVAGVVERINKVISVRPIRSRYVGEIGDVVVGRITEVGHRRWKVDTQSRLDSVLRLSSVNLPGGTLRRKSAEDELMMREFFQEGDLLSGEVQMVHQEDGSLSLHTRSLKYGKLGPGTFLVVPAGLVKRSKNHFHTLPCGVGVVLGNNGYIWIGGPLSQPTEDGARTDEVPSSGAVQNVHMLRRRFFFCFTAPACLAAPLAHPLRCWCVHLTPRLVSSQSRRS